MKKSLITLLLAAACVVAIHAESLPSGVNHEKGKNHRGHRGQGKREGHHHHAIHIFHRHHYHDKNDSRSNGHSYSHHGRKGQGNKDAAKDK